MTDRDVPAGGQRHTRQREIVHGVVASGDFRTTQEIFDILHQRGERIGLATVYRTLQSMADAGDVDAIRTPDGQMAYRQCSTGHHHHLICRVCGRTVEIASPQVETWLATLGEAYGFADIDHELELQGRCSDCRS